MFQSAPGLATGGNVGIAAVVGVWDMFQSAPGLATGGNAAAIQRLENLGCFNPPPVSRPGETIAEYSAVLATLSFQSAPGLATGGNEVVHSY